MHAFIVDQQFQTAEQHEIVLACSASGEEIKAAFTTPDSGSSVMGGKVR